MSMKRMLFATSAVIALIAAATDASAQYRYYERQTLDRQRYQRPIATTKSVRAPKADTMAARTAAPAVKKPADQTPKRAPAPAAPLSAEELAAKAAVDELMAREPALAAARERPDPKLAREAAARHDAEEKRRAALQARQETAAAKHKAIADKIKTRDNAKGTPIRAKQEAPPKYELANVEPNKVKLDGRGPAAPVKATQAVLRMPTPDAVPPLGPRPR